MEKSTELRNKYQQRVEAEDQPELFKRKKKEMSDAERVFTLQSKLYQKAKQDAKKSLKGSGYEELVVRSTQHSNGSLSQRTKPLHLL